MSTVPGEAAPGVGPRAAHRALPAGRPRRHPAAAPPARRRRARLGPRRAGLVGWGEAARLEVTGPDRFARARDWWRELVAHADVEDEVGVPRQRAGRLRLVRLPRRRAVGARRARGGAGAPRRADLADHVGDPPRLAAPEPVRATRGLRYAARRRPGHRVPRRRRGGGGPDRRGRAGQGGARPRPAGGRRGRHRRPRRAGRAGRAQPGLLDVRGRRAGRRDARSCW